MPKQQLLPTGGGSKLLPKLIGGLVLLALLAVVVKHPADAADWVTTMASRAGNAVDGLASFFRTLAN